MAIQNLSDKRINTRSPYYITSRTAPVEVVLPPETTPPPENEPPTVTITADKTNPCLSETVTLTATATDSDGTVVSYDWEDQGHGTIIPFTTSIEVTHSTAESVTYGVTVTDDDGDTANATIVVDWQECVNNVVEDFNVECGDTVLEGALATARTYILNVGDKVGDVEIQFLDTNGTHDVPVKFTGYYNGSMVATTNYLGADWYDDQLTGDGLGAEIATGDPSTKGTGTTLTLNKPTATPETMSLIAEPYIPNDSFSFKLVCPNVRTPITKYYTLEGTCTSGDTTFTYLDVNGDSQSVVLANGETQLVSAIEDSVSIPICTGDVTEGGESFDLGTPEQQLDETTELTIVFDDSGSMGKTLQYLVEMSKGVLKDKLLSYYNNDQVEYDKKVRVVTSGNLALELFPSVVPNSTEHKNLKERFLILATRGFVNPDANKSIYMFFTDEVQGVYQQFTPGAQIYASYTFITSTYSQDISDYRDFLNSSTSYGEHFMKVFNVKDYQNKLSSDLFIENIFTGNQDFYGSRGLSDRSECSVVSDVSAEVSYSSNPSYYYDLIIQALQDYGFKI